MAGAVSEKMLGDIRDMAITAAHLKIAIRGRFLAQQVEVVQWYRPTGAAFLTATPDGVGEAFWNDIKTVWRGLFVESVALLTESIFVSEPGSSGAYGEYPVPTAEQQGTRVISTPGSFMPPYTAIGVRLTVGTRTTRPGQKRFWGMVEADNSDGIAGSNLYDATEAAAEKFSSVITLGAPVATGTLTPEIVRINRATGDIVAYQDVTGFLVNTELTTQNSRKFGRGS